MTVLLTDQAVSGTRTRRVLYLVFGLDEFLKLQEGFSLSATSEPVIPPRLWAVTRIYGVGEMPVLLVAWAASRI
jgi:hypothetical protein